MSCVNQELLRKKNRPHGRTAGAHGIAAYRHSCRALGLVLLVPLPRAIPRFRVACIRCVRFSGVIAALGTALAAPPEPTSENLVVGGVKRHYLMVVPTGRSAAAGFPLVLVFHPKNTDAALIERSLPFPEQAERRGFIAVFPDGLEHQWNGGRKRLVAGESKSSDDVDFVAAILDSVGTRYPIDMRRVFATGISNGAIFCYSLASRLSDRIAAIGPVAGAIGVNIPGKFAPAHPVSVIAFNGTADTFVPYNGNPDPDSGILSAPDSVAYWVKVDGCDPKAVVTELPQAVPDDGTSVVRIAFTNGAAGSEVVSYVVLHGGHTWPGQRTNPSDPKGRSTMAVDATREILDFFKQHPKP